MSFSQINSTRSICNLSLSLFLAGCLYGQGTVVEVHKLPSHPLANFQNTYLPGSVPVGASDFGYTLGGIGSGLFKGPGDGPGIFWMISDRGPNPQDASSPIRRAFPTPWYTPFILQVKTEDNNGPITVLQALPLVGTDAFGSRVAVTGLPNDPSTVNAPANPLPLQDERAFICALGAGAPGSSLKFITAMPDGGGNHDGHDTEDVVRDVHGNFWTIEEYGPSISKVDPTGRVLKRFVPVGRGSVSGSVENHFTVVENLPQILGRRPRNRGFEALAITPDQKTLMAMVQSPLTNPTAAVGNPSLVIRLIAFDIETETPTAEYVYVMQSVDEFKPSPANPTEMKISAMSALDQHRFLIDERTDLVAKLYIVDIRRATNILGTHWDNLPMSLTEPTLESLAQYIAATPVLPPLPPMRFSQTASSNCQRPCCRSL